jgi:hypothetical protein
LGQGLDLIDGLSLADEEVSERAIEAKWVTIRVSI